jgi:hypothetical protein
MLALVTLLAAWPPLLPAAPPTEPAAPRPVRFYFASADVRRALPPDAIKRVGLVADLHAFEAGVAAAGFTSALREQGQEVVPLPVVPGAPEQSARQLAASHRVDAVAVLRVGGLAGEGAVVDIWSRNGAHLETLVARLPPTPEEQEGARREAEYATRHLTVSGDQQFLGDGKKSLSRSDFYGLVGRRDLEEKEEGLAVARGALIGVGVTAASVGAVVELLQLVAFAVIAPIDIGACELSRDLGSSSHPNGSVDSKPCNGPEMSPVPLFIIAGGGLMAISGGAMRGDATSSSEREDLARAYNLRLREGLTHPKPTPAVSVGVSPTPEGGMLLLRGRF